MPRIWKERSEREVGRICGLIGNSIVRRCCVWSIAIVLSNCPYSRLIGFDINAVSQSPPDRHKDFLSPGNPSTASLSVLTSAVLRMPLELGLRPAIQSLSLLTCAPSRLVAPAGVSRQIPICMPVVTRDICRSSVREGSSRRGWCQLSHHQY